MAAAAFVAACGGSDAGWEPKPARELTVPETDRTPPEVLLRIERGGRVLADTRGELSPNRAYFPRVDLRGRLRAVGVGRDLDGGLGRIRVSIAETVECRAPGGPAHRRRQVRYVPPPMIERIRLAPGTRTSTHRTRSVPIAACRPGERAVGVAGEAWAEATNAHGLEAVSSHLRFRARP